MNNPFDHIEEFLAGELSETDAQSFKQAMSTDAGLREEVNMVKEMDLFAQRKADNKNAIDVVREVMEDEKRIEEGRRKGSSLIRTIAAAVVLCLIALAAWVYFSQEEKVAEYDKLYAEYFEQPEMAIIRKGESQDSLIQLVQGLFNSKQYENSLDVFKTIKRSEEVDLYLAINYQLLNQADSSLVILNSFENQSNDTHWFKAMAYLKMENPTKAKEWLQKIDSRSVHYTKSQSLIKQL